MAEIIKAPEVRPVGGIVDTYVKPVAQPKQQNQLGQFMQALAPAIAVEEDKALKEKQKRDAEIASEELKNKAHQIDLAYTNVIQKIDSDFKQNGDTYLNENTHEQVMEKYNAFWTNYSQQMLDSGVDKLLVNGFNRKMELDLAAFGLKLGDAYRVKNIEKQDATLLGVIGNIADPEEVKVKANNHINATGGNAGRVNQMLVDEAVRLSKLGQGAGLIEALQTFGRDGTNIFNIEKHRDSWVTIQSNLATYGKQVANANKKGAATATMQQLFQDYFDRPEGLKLSEKLSIGNELTIDLGSGVTHSFTPTFDDYRPMMEAAFAQEMTDIESAPIPDTAKTQLRYDLERKRFEFYLDHNEAPRDTTIAITDGAGGFRQGNLQDEAVVAVTRQAYDKLEQVYAYSDGEFIPHVLKDTDLRNRYLAIRQLVRDNVDFTKAVGIVQGYVRFKDDPYEFTVKEVQDVIDTSYFFHYTDLDETDVVRSNLVLAEEVSEYATMLYNTGTVNDRGEALQKAALEIGKHFVAVKGTGGQMSAIRLQRGDANKTATVEGMEKALTTLRDNVPAMMAISEMFPDGDVSPVSIFGGGNSFDLIYEPTTNPNVVHVWAVRQDDPNNLAQGQLIGHFDLTKSPELAAEEFTQRTMERLNLQLEEEGEDSWYDRFGDKIIRLFGISEAGAAELTPEDIQQLAQTVEDVTPAVEEMVDEEGMDLGRAVMEGLYRARDTGEEISATIGNIIRSYFSDEEVGIVLGDQSGKEELVQARESISSSNEGHLSQALNIAVRRGKATSDTKQRIIDEILLPIAYHESNRTLDPNTQQMGSKIAKGMLQMEAPRVVASVKRMARILKKEGKPIPDWAKEMVAQADRTQAQMEEVQRLVNSRTEPMTPVERKILYENPVYDVSKLTADQQLALGLYDMLGYKGDINDVLDGKMSIEKFWAEYWHQGDSPQAQAAFASNYRKLQTLMGN